eukprot:6745204-Prymnesium_polylepis.1
MAGAASPCKELEVCQTTLPSCASTARMSADELPSAAATLPTHTSKAPPPGAPSAVIAHPAVENHVGAGWL